MKVLLVLEDFTGSVKEVYLSLLSAIELAALVIDGSLQTRQLGAFGRRLCRSPTPGELVDFNFLCVILPVLYHHTSYPEGHERSNETFDQPIEWVEADEGGWRRFGRPWLHCICS